MVHRQPDSRLLTNLLSQEKEYSKHLNTLLDHSHSSLASFSAYAAASSPPASHVILTVAGFLASSDDALRRYAASVDLCREHLKALKDLEDEFGNIMRDREILVTRLLKASKSHKPSRTMYGYPSHLGGPSTGPWPSSSSSLSLSHQSHISYLSHSAISPTPISTSAKLSAAQAELQACEAHLATKERELAARRVAAFREGMALRCNAMVECGWVWGEMGREALKTLSALGVIDTTIKSLPHEPMSMHAHRLSGSHPGSELSSLAPSQSASQTNVNTNQPGLAMGGNNITPSGSVAFPEVKLPIPAPHAISDADHTYTLPYAPTIPPARPSPPLPPAPPPPTAVISLASSPTTRHVLSRRITEEDLSQRLSTADEKLAEAAQRLQDEEQRQQQQKLQVQPEEEEAEEDGSSLEEPQPEIVQVVENPRFSNGNAKPAPAPAPAPAPVSTPTNATFPPQPPSPVPMTPVNASRTSFIPYMTAKYSPQQSSPKQTKKTQVQTLTSEGRRQRRTSTAFFGSLRGIFGHHHPHQQYQTQSPQGSPKSTGGFTSSDHEKEKKPGVLSNLFRHDNGSASGRWETRTDKNLKALRKRDKGSSDGERGVVDVFDGPGTSPSRNLAGVGRRSIDVPPQSQSQNQGSGGVILVTPPPPLEQIQVSRAASKASSKGKGGKKGGDKQAGTEGGQKPQLDYDPRLPPPTSVTRRRRVASDNGHSNPVAVAAAPSAVVGHLKSQSSTELGQYYAPQEQQQPAVSKPGKLKKRSPQGNQQQRTPPPSSPERQTHTKSGSGSSSTFGISIGKTKGTSVNASPSSGASHPATANGNVNHPARLPVFNVPPPPVGPPPLPPAGPAAGTAEHAQNAGGDISRSSSLSFKRKSAPPAVALPIVLSASQAGTNGVVRSGSLKKRTVSSPQVVQVEAPPKLPVPMSLPSTPAVASWSEVATSQARAQSQLRSQDPKSQTPHQQRQQQQHRRSASVPPTAVVQSAAASAHISMAGSSLSGFGAYASGSGNAADRAKKEEKERERFRHLYPDPGSMNLLSVVEVARWEREEHGRDKEEEKQSEEEKRPSSAASVIRKGMDLRHAADGAAEPELERGRPPSRDRITQRVSAPPTIRAAGGDRGSLSTPASSLASLHGSSSSRPAMSPLRSALKRSSRTPTPSPVRNGTLPEAGEVVRRPVFRRAESSKEMGREVESDAASISSYETGGDIFFDAPQQLSQDKGKEREETPDVGEMFAPPKGNEQEYMNENEMRRNAGYVVAVEEGPTPPRKKSPPNGHAAPVPSASFRRERSIEEVHVYSGDEHDRDADGEENVADPNAKTKRRKSVRVSLKPTFSPDPPVMYDSSSSSTASEKEQSRSWYRSAPASDPGHDGGRKGKDKNMEKHERGAKKDKKEPKAWEDVWVDSSEEDEEYSRAKRMLGRVGGAGAPAHGKGKGRAV